MHESATALPAWEAFYLIVGTSGGALIGLQFIVITLIADRRQLVTGGSLSAFGTPTVVHFVGALVVSSTMCVPWPSLVPLSIALGMCGLGGLAYGGIVIARARRQTAYQPVWEDWLWHAVLPCLSYAALTVTAVVLRRDPQLAMFVIGSAALALLLIGIHNAWDTVTYVVLSSSGDQTKTEQNPTFDDKSRQA